MQKVALKGFYSLELDLLSNMFKVILCRRKSKCSKTIHDSNDKTNDHDGGMICIKLAQCPSSCHITDHHVLPEKNEGQSIVISSFLVQSANPLPKTPKWCGPQRFRFIYPLEAIDMDLPRGSLVFTSMDTASERQTTQEPSRLIQPFSPCRAFLPSKVRSCLNPYKKMLPLRKTQVWGQEQSKRWKKLRLKPVHSGLEQNSNEFIMSLINTCAKH